MAVLTTVAVRTHPPHDKGMAGSVCSMRRRDWRTLLAALLVSLCGLATIEWLGRMAGYRPSVRDSRELWRFWRERIRTRDPGVVVLLGTSRMQADVSLEVLEACLPGRRAIQLAVQGPGSSLSILQDLATDPDFCGTVICELETPLLEQRHWDDLRAYRTYEPGLPAEYCDTVFRDWLDDKFVALHRALTLRSCCSRIVHRGPGPAAEKVHMRFTRQTQCELSSVPDQEGLRRRAVEDFRSQYELNGVPTFDSMWKEIEDVDRVARTLSSRGGLVVFVRLPSSGDHWRIEEKYHPKSNWDRFASMTDATCIHFRDVVDMQGFNLPDESHLDFCDAPRFTRALVSELRRRGSVR
jgi:hypothetical protein